MPSEVAQLGLADFQLNLLVASIGYEEEGKVADKAMKAGR